MDKEKQEEIKILTNGEHLKAMTLSSGWGIARQMIVDKILELQMIGDLLSMTPTTMAQHARARKEASTILYEFLAELEGNVEQHENNKPTTLTEDSYIIRG